MLKGIANYLNDMYQEGKITEAKLDNAVAKNWITEEEKQEIVKQ